MSQMALLDCEWGSFGCSARKGNICKTVLLTVFLFRNFYIFLCQWKEIKRVVVFRSVMLVLF